MLRVGERTVCIESGTLSLYPHRLETMPNRGLRRTRNTVFCTCHLRIQRPCETGGRIRSIAVHLNGWTKRVAHLLLQVASTKIRGQTRHSR